MSIQYDPNPSDLISKRILAERKVQTFFFPSQLPQGPSNCPCGAIGPHNHKIIEAPFGGCSRLTGPIERLAQARVHHYMAYNQGRGHQARAPRGEVRVFEGCHERCVDPGHLYDDGPATGRQS